MASSVTLIGFGEAGQTFAGDADWSARTRVYDRLTEQAGARDAKRADYVRIGVEGCETLAEAVSGAPLMLSLVTAGEAERAARGAATWIGADALYCDCNSVAPQTKQAAATAIERRGGAYVDVAIMSPVDPARLKAPLLLSGPRAEDAAEALTALGFTNLRVVGDRVGEASAIKMIRSVIVKGVEALTAEAMLAADALGVTGEVLASLDASDKAMPWERRADYNLDRMMVHGLRRADEMEEVVRTLEGVGVAPLMSSGAVERQRRIGALGLKSPAEGLPAKIAQIDGARAEQRQGDAA